CTYLNSSSYDQNQRHAFSCAKELSEDKRSLDHSSAKSGTSAMLVGGGVPGGAAAPPKKFPLNHCLRSALEFRNRSNISMPIARSIAEACSMGCRNSSAAQPCWIPANCASVQPSAWSASQVGGIPMAATAIRTSWQMISLWSREALTSENK